MGSWDRAGIVADSIMEVREKRNKKINIYNISITFLYYMHIPYLLKNNF